MTPTIKEIEKAACATFGVTGWDLHAEWDRKGARSVAIVRQVIFYLARELTKKSLPQIGAEFGRDHSTVLAGVRSIERKLASGHPITSAVAMLRGQIESDKTGWDISTWFPLVRAFDPATFAQYRSPLCKCGRGHKVAHSNYCRLCLSDHYAARKALKLAEKYGRRRKVIAFAQAHAPASSGVRS